MGPPWGGVSGALVGMGIPEYEAKHVDKTKEAAKATGQKLKNAGEKLKDQGS